MHVAALRRYPVKSMGGEDMTSAPVGARGIEGDRWFAVEDADGKLASGKHTRRFRRYDAVFDYAASTVDGRVVVRRGDRSWSVGDEALDDELSRAMSAAVRVTPEGAVGHFDEVPLSLVGTATLAWCADRYDVRADPRRLRVNIVVETDEPFVEETWLDQRITLGGVTVLPHKRITRCRMIDIDQDGATAEGRWLTSLAEDRESCLTIGASVVSPGVVDVGAPVSPAVRPG